MSAAHVSRILRSAGHPRATWIPSGRGRGNWTSGFHTEENPRANGEVLVEYITGSWTGRDVDGPATETALSEAAAILARHGYAATRPTEGYPRLIVTRAFTTHR